MRHVHAQWQIEEFRRGGCVLPGRALPEGDALELRQRVEALEADSGVPPGTRLRQEYGLVLGWSG